jgi:hypothetical protein
MTYRGTTKPIADIGRELGVDYVLDGSIRGGEGRYRVTATLNRVRDQVQVWSDTYERESPNLLGLQAELGRSIAEQIHLRLSPERARAITRRQTRNPEAYDVYLRGRYHWNQLTPATVARALECYQRATELDPEYALAWAGIADAYSSRPFNSDTQPSEVYERARTAAAHALLVGETVAEAHTSAAFVQFVFGWDWPAAEANCRKAVALDPSYGQGYWMLAHTLSQQGFASGGVGVDRACVQTRSAQRDDSQHGVADCVSGARLRGRRARRTPGASRRTGLLGRAPPARAGAPATWPRCTRTRCPG